MSRTLFGTDGIRGEANVYPMTADVAMRLGRALGWLVKNGRLGREQPSSMTSSSATLLPSATSAHRRVVIGKDTRVSGYLIEQAIAAGLTSMGVDVMLTGPLPTPGVAFITSSMRADAGIVVSASHNPYQDNGIKVFAHDGFKLPDVVEEELERLIMNPAELEVNAPTGRDIGKAFRIDDAKGRYIVHLKATFPQSLTLEGLKVVVDCAHGAAYAVAPHVFRELGATVIELGTQPDGCNINDGCGSLFPKLLQQTVIGESAHFGVALDGDADRLIVVDERGQIVDGDAVMALCARELHKKGKLAGACIVATVMSNVGLERSLRDVGITVERVQVGDRYVVERMKARGLNLGGEQSGHVVFLDHATTGDGCVAALAVVAAMLRERKSLSALASVFTASPQELLNFAVKKKTPLEDLPDVLACIVDVEKELGPTGRVLVRYSGTEMKARVMVEGDDAEVIRAHAKKIATVLQGALS
ncbi:MAG: phosphoglucosamine mutase [Deltaproteobacteria bacterium]|nr:phosphoglucosamine mutase [Deltaproteobacteria bacterium]